MSTAGMETDLSALSPNFPLALSPLPDQPLVSILMANRNYGAFIGDAIESVLAQSYATWELLICDDDSTDDSVAQVEYYSSRHPRITLIAGQGRGQAAAWNLLYPHCQGAVLCFLDSDDVFHPNKLAKVIAAFRQSPAAGFCAHAIQPVDERMRPILPPLPRNIPSGWVAPSIASGASDLPMPPTSGFCLRREVANLLWPVPEGPSRDLYLRLAAQFFTEIVPIEEPLCWYRVHSRNISGFLPAEEEPMNQSLLSIESNLVSVSEVVARHRGADTAAALHLAGYTSYWHLAMALFLLRGKPAEGVRGHTGDAIRAHLPQCRQSSLLLLLGLCPRPLPRALLRLWKGTRQRQSLPRILYRYFGRPR